MKANKKTATQKLEETLERWVIEKYQPLINENEQLKIKNKQLEQTAYRYREQASRLQSKNSKLRELLEGKSKTYDMLLSKIIYVVYDRDQEGKIVALGNIQECAEVLDRTPDYLRHCATPKAQKDNHKYKVVKLGKT